MKNLILILSIFIFSSCITKDKTLERPFVIIDKQMTIYYEYQDKNGQRKTFESQTADEYCIGDTIK